MKLSYGLLMVMASMIVAFYGSVIGVAIGITVTGDYPPILCFLTTVIVLGCAAAHIELVARIVFRRGI